MTSVTPLMCVCRTCYPLDHAPATQEDLLCDCCGGRCHICGIGPACVTTPARTPSASESSRPVGSATSASPCPVCGYDDGHHPECGDWLAQNALEGAS